MVGKEALVWTRKIEAIKNWLEGSSCLNEKDWSNKELVGRKLLLILYPCQDDKQHLAVIWADLRWQALWLNVQTPSFSVSSIDEVNYRLIQRHLPLEKGLWFPEMPLAQTQHTIRHYLGKDFKKKPLKYIILQRWNPLHGLYTCNAHSQTCFKSFYDFAVVKYLFGL